MKLIRHILSHLLLITILFGLVSIYYYRHQVLPDGYAQKIDLYAEKIHPELKSFARKKQLQSDTRQAVVESQKGNESVALKPELVEPESVEITETDQSATPEQTAMAEQVIEKEQPTTSDIAISDVPVAEEEKLQTPIENTVTEEFSVKEDVTSIVSSVVTGSEGQPIAGKNENNENTLTMDKDAASANDLLRAARQAFQQGNMDAATEKYNELVELENDEADFYGELGNVYYAMGSWDKAGVAYYEAATRLIEEKQFSQVAYLQRVIQGLDAERAEKLAARLMVLNRTGLNR